MQDLESIRRLKAGDIAGLEWLVSQYQEGALRAAYLVSGQLQMAEDVVQDAFVLAYKHIGSYDEARPFAPWFMRIVLNLAVKSSQRESKHRYSTTSLDEEEAEALLWEATQSVEEAAEASDLRKRVWSAMQSLAPRQRAVIVQRYYLSMSESEMAVELGLARGTIKWLLSNARSRLRRLLKEDRRSA